MGRFFDKFNFNSEGEFSFLRLSLINVFLSTQTSEFCFVCPEDKFDLTLSKKEQIKVFVEKSFDTLFKISVKITKSHFDEYFFMLKLIDFFEFYPSLKGCVDKRCVKFCKDEKTNTHLVSITLKQSAYHVFVSRNLMQQLNDFVFSNYCESIKVEVTKSDAEEVFEESDFQKYSLEESGGRIIKVQNSEGLIGPPIYQPATYICDATVCQNAILSGFVNQLKQLQRKPKDGKQKPDFYKFNLNDTTSNIECVFFPNEKNVNDFSLLKEGKAIIAEGKIEYNEFNDKKTLTFYPKRISLCTFPDDFKINRLRLNIPKNYKYVFPLNYEEYLQASFFSTKNSSALNNDNQASLNDIAINKDKSISDNQKNINKKFFLDKTFCVFDIETTGLDRINDKIIEIGAVKIQNGVFTQTFSTLIDPQVVLPEKIKKLTGINDEDLKDARLFKEILPDLLKFFDDSILVGYNSEFFDFPFLSNAASKYNVFFDNKRMDAYLLTKQYITLKQYQLKDVAKHYNVINPNAHRALDDAITTAKILMHLADFFDN